MAVKMSSLNRCFLLICDGKNYFHPRFFNGVFSQNVYSTASMTVICSQMVINLFTSGDYFDHYA